METLQETKPRIRKKQIAKNIPDCLIYETINNSKV